MTISYGFLLYCLLTDNLLLSVGYFLLKMSNEIPVELELTCIFVLILFSIAKKLLKVGGV